MVSPIAATNWFANISAIVFWGSEKQQDKGRKKQLASLQNNMHFLIL